MPRFPLYIPSKGRHQFMVTPRALTAMGVRHHIVVEPQEADAYRESVKRMNLLTEVVVLDMSYKSKYELCDNLGLSKSTGSSPARNFIWDHSIASGHSWHWIMDDNIKCFRRLHGSAKIKVTTPAFWVAMEDFVLRYKNVAMAGPNYTMFAYSGAGAFVPPFYLNTRIYSCNLIRNDVPFRWRGRYNEDTILSLDMIKSGWCTILFNAFLQEKMATQTLPGGNTSELYKGDGKADGEKYARNGTLEKSLMLVRVHPDCANMVWKFQRWHHHVDYTRFRNQKLIKREDVDVKRGVNDYGMKLVKISKPK